jgi:hypothetical protein
MLLARSVAATYTDELSDRAFVSSHTSLLDNWHLVTNGVGEYRQCAALLRHSIASPRTYAITGPGDEHKLDGAMVIDVIDHTQEGIRSTGGRQLLFQLLDCEGQSSRVPKQSNRSQRITDSDKHVVPHTITSTMPGVF